MVLFLPSLFLTFPKILCSRVARQARVPLRRRILRAHRPQSRRNAHGEQPTSLIPLKTLFPHAALSEYLFPCPVLSLTKVQPVTVVDLCP
jgi:hypothetical protein